MMNIFGEYEAASGFTITMLATPALSDQSCPSSMETLVLG